MLRTVFCSVAVALFLVSGLAGAEKKAAKEGANLHKVTLVKVDVAKNAVTFVRKDKAGKAIQVTLPLAKNVMVYGLNNKTETLAAFATDIGKNKDKTFWIRVDKEKKQIVELREYPNPAAAGHARAK